MNVELAGSFLYFVFSVAALLFSLAKSSSVDRDSFPNRGRFFSGLIIWVVASILAIFMSFPGYSQWFVPTIYPVFKIVFVILFLTGLFMLLTTVVAFPHRLHDFRREVTGTSDRVALLENIRQITGQPYPITELFALVLKELASFLTLKKGAVFLINPSRREMYLVAQIGLSRDELSRLERFAIGQDMVSRAAMEQAPIVSGDMTSADSASRKLLLAGKGETHSAAALPLAARDRSLGALVALSDKPYCFDKQDRLLLMAAAESLAGLVEMNRLARENQKLAQSAENAGARLNGLREIMALLVRTDDQSEALTSICRFLTERSGAAGCRMVRLVRGEVEELARSVTISEASDQGESYRLAVIDAIMRRKMVVLNQEARGAGGASFVTRSTLLCPIAVAVPGEHAFLIEAPGQGLNLTESFMADIEAAAHLAATGLNIAALRESDELNQVSTRSLLNILRLSGDSPNLIIRQFIDEVGRILRPTTSALIYVKDQRSGYRILDGCHIDGANIVDGSFAPGEGPVGKAATTGEIGEYAGRDKVDEAWRDLEPVNHDFFSRLFAEKGSPAYQLTVPIRALDDVVAVLALFSHESASSATRREKGVMLVAAQLLSIKLSLSRRIDQPTVLSALGAWGQAGHILNSINNDLATILGRAQLMSGQPENPGPTRYASDEIIHAAESAADAIKKLQENLKPSIPIPAPAGARSLSEMLNAYFDRRRVTGNLYMFDDNRPVILQVEARETAPFISPDPGLYPILETVLRKFVALLQEGEEVLCRTEQLQGAFYVSLVRGSRDRHRQFNPADHDFGDPDVFPPDLAGEDGPATLIRNKVMVSFDRFGRRPTYLSFKFGHPLSAAAAVAKSAPAISGMRILAIDDQQMILDLLASICGSLGLAVTTALDPGQGLDLFRREKFDLVMVDLVMGASSGWDVAREIKRYSPETTVIMMTGWGIDLDSVEAAGGAVDFTLAKPFKIEQLTEILELARLKQPSS